jgi:hypothetical protein
LTYDNPSFTTTCILPSRDLCFAAVEEGHMLLDIASMTLDPGWRAAEAQKWLGNGFQWLELQL